MEIKSMKGLEVKIYQFGSSLCSDEPNDLDILIIYRLSKFDKIYEVIYLKNNIKLKMEAIFLIPVDIILLSESEAFQLHYLDKITYRRIF